MKSLFIILISFLSIGCISTGKQKIIARELSFVACEIKDYEQTTMISKNADKYYEKSNAWLIGKHPSENTVRNYFLIRTLTHAGIALSLPEKYSKIWQDSFIIESMVNLANNAAIGLDSKTTLKFKVTYSIDF